jgi:hypothetical protein
MRKFRGKSVYNGVLLKEKDPAPVVTLMAVLLVLFGPGNETATAVRIPATPGKYLLERTPNTRECEWIVCEEATRCAMQNHVLWKAQRNKKWRQLAISNAYFPPVQIGVPPSVIATVLLTAW